jgi:hypothetical protein
MPAPPDSIITAPVPPESHSLFMAVSNGTRASGLALKLLSLGFRGKIMRRPAKPNGIQTWCYPKL